MTSPLTPALCPNCSQPVPSDAAVCPHCAYDLGEDIENTAEDAQFDNDDTQGRYAPPVFTPVANPIVRPQPGTSSALFADDAEASYRSRIIIAVVGAIIVAIIAFFAFKGDAEPTAKKEPTQQTAQQPSTEQPTTADQVEPEVEVQPPSADGAIVPGDEAEDVVEPEPEPENDSSTDQSTNGSANDSADKGDTTPEKPSADKPTTKPDTDKPEQNDKATDKEEDNTLKDSKETPVDLKWDRWKTADGNVHCRIADEIVRCDLKKSDVEQTAKDCDDNRTVILKRHYSARLDCADNTIIKSTDPVLPEGRRTVIGPFTCTADTSAVSCTAKSGHSFVVSRKQYILD